MLLATLRLFAGEGFGGPLASGFHMRVAQHSARTMSGLLFGQGCRLKDATNSVTWEMGGGTINWRAQLGPVPLSHKISVPSWSRAGTEGKDLRGVSLIR